MSTALRFYLDENVPVEVARQLSMRGIEVTTTRDQNLLGAPDEQHLATASAEGYVFCTYDTDYLAMAADGIAHRGIVFAQQDIHYVGDSVNWLSLMHAVYSMEEMANRIEFI